MKAKTKGILTSGTKLKILVLTSLICVSCSVLSQQNNVRTNILDSLQQLLKGNNDDTTQIKILLQLSQNYRQVDKEKSLSYAEKALTASKKTDWRKGYYSSLNNKALTIYSFGERQKALDIFLSAYNEALNENELRPQYYLVAGIANCYYRMGEKDSALKYRLLSKSFSERTHDKHGLSSDLMNLGLVYEEMGDYKKELDCYQKALAIQEELHDDSNAANTLENLGIFFIYRQDSLNAFKHLFKALAIRQKLGEKNAEATTTNNIAGAYTMFGDPETGLTFLMKALQIHEATGDLAGIASTTNNICEVYGEMKNYPKAIEFAKRSMVAHAKSNDSAGIAICYKNLASIYSRTGKLTEAENAARTAFTLSNKYGSKDMILDGYIVLADILFQKGDTRNAYLLHKQYSSMKDSIMTVENSKQINEMNVKYESEKKDKALLLKDNEIKLKEAESLQKSYQRNGFIAGFAILFILVFLIFRSYKLKKNAHLIISKQKEEVERAKELIEEHQKEIIDSITYARRIQRSLLPTEKYIERTLTRLKNK